MKQPQGSIVVELVLIAMILAFVAGAIIFANNKQPTTSNQAAVSTSKSVPQQATTAVGQITSAGDIDKSIKELDQESASQLDTELDDVDASLKSL